MNVIYTVITGKKDILNESINTQGTRAVCFTDDPDLKSDVWEVKLIPLLFKDIRRDSRIPKMLPHIFFPEADYSLYVDANIISKVPINKLIIEWLQDSDIAMFGHVTRDCLFDEAQECIRLELDTKEAIESQIERYKDFPKHQGLYQGGVILRRHTPQIKRLNESWFTEYCTGCKRDQVSLPYVVEKEGVTINSIKGHAYSHEWFEMDNHAILSEWALKL